MRLINRHRHHPRAKPPRIQLSQAEITADLHYPAGRPVARHPDGTGERRRSAR